MPVCPRCDTAYLESEPHVCARSRWWSINPAGVALLLPVATEIAVRSYPAALLALFVGFTLLVQRWPEYWFVLLVAYLPSMGIMMGLLATWL